MKSDKGKWIRFRIYVVTAVFVTGLGVLWARAFQLQVTQREWLTKTARKGYVGTIPLPPKRGVIYDRDGNELAVSVEVGSVYAHPKLVEDPVETARSLADILNVPRRQILNQLRRDHSFVWIERKVAPNLARKVTERKMRGVGILRETRRYYPGKEIAGHLLGFDGIDNQGLEGLEKKYDSLLTGKPYRLVQMRDALGRAFSVRRDQSSDQGAHDLTLTIDKKIQYRAQQALEAAVRKTEAKAGQCIVVNPKTGEILAMALVPEFNPNIFTSYRPEDWRNRTITDCFEPGSTIKAFLLAASLEESVVTEDSTFDCERGSYRIGGHVVNDTHAHGVLNVREIVVKSSNIGAIKLGEQLGYQRFCEYLRRFGFGGKTGIDLLGEREGYIRPVEQTEPLDRASLYFGQGMSTTALQMAMAMAAVANGGLLMRPYVVDSVKDASGSVVKKTPPVVIRRVLSEDTARTVARILEDVVSEEGTGSQARIRGFRVAGKTGTAQKVDSVTKTYSNDKYVAMFAGFVPVEDPEMVILVVIDEPEGSPYGGVTAAPVFCEVGRWSLNHIGVFPSENSFSVASGPPTTKLSQKKLVLHVENSRGTTGDNSPGNSERVGQDEDMVSSLPDFSGMGMREVLTQGRRLGLEVTLEGTGLAAEQEPPPGSPLDEAKRLRVRFRPPA